MSDTRSKLTMAGVSVIDGKIKSSEVATAVRVLAAAPPKAEWKSSPSGKWIKNYGDGWYGVVQETTPSTVIEYYGRKGLKIRKYVYYLTKNTRQRVPDNNGNGNISGAITEKAARDACDRAHAENYGKDIEDREVSEEVCGNCGWEGDTKDCHKDARHIYCPECELSL
jgi:hypothetical protein